MRITVIAASLLLLAGSHVSAAEDIIATVNGTKIKKQTFEMYLKYIQSANPNANVDPRLVLAELIKVELLHQEAVKQKLDKDPEVAARAELQRKEFLANTLLQRSDVAKPVTEEEMQKFYDEKVKTQNITEYKARHILVTDELVAKGIIEELDKGGNFEELAKTKSTDTASAKEGGDLGWFNPAQMVPEFSSVVANMQKGTFTRTPVKTRYGFHIIKLEDSRAVTPPSFEDSKKRIAQAIQQARLNEYLEKLHKKAKIEITGAKPPAAAGKANGAKPAKEPAKK